MDILITGHKGYIGSRLMQFLKCNSENTVYGLDLQDGQNILTSDLPDVDVVIHLAAQAGAMPSVEDPVWDAETNIVGTVRLANHYGKRYRHFIYVTSGAAIEAKSPYGLSKKTGEAYVKMLAPVNTILRFSSIFGEKPKGVVDNFVREQILTIYGDGSAVRDFVHVDDIVRGLAMAIEWQAGEYSMGSGKGVTVKELAEATGKQITYRMKRQGEVDKAILENTTPDWEPVIDVLDYVRRKC